MADAVYPTPWSHPVTAKVTPMDIDASVAHPARVYDYWLGGKDNFEADRQVAEMVIAGNPGVRQSARDNRAFLGRAVRFLAGQGIRQFLDIGSGIPSKGNTHEIAQAIAPESRIVYVDNDPIVMSHSRALLSSSPQGAVSYIQADLRDPEAILNDSQTRAVIDVDQPVAILLVAILMYIQDSEEPHGIVKRLLDAVPPGSYLVISHLVAELVADEQNLQVLRQFNQSASVPMTPRSGSDIAGFFEGLDLLEPGLVTVAHWRPDGPVFDDQSAGMYAGVAKKP
jgi:hypothetical protein